jgi:splicing factor 3B subunit 2
MERVLKFRDNQHEEDRVTKLHSGGHQTDSGIDQNDEYDDESDEETSPQNGLSRKAKKEIEKRRRRRAKKKNKSTAPPPAAPLPPSQPTKSLKENDTKKKQKKRHESDDDDDNLNVEIEYIQEDIPIKRGDGYYSHFVKVFENFKLDQNGDDNTEYHYNKYGKKVPGPKVLLPRDKTNIDENEDDDDDDKETINHDKKKKDLDDEEQNKKISKKQLKRETRLSVAQLKQLVTRPDVVEMFDVTAKDPKLLVHLKVNIFSFIKTKLLWCFLGNT